MVSLHKTTSLLSEVISSKQQNSVVSSAYIKKLNSLLKLGKSFIYIYISKTKGVQVLTLVGLHYE